MKEVTFPKSYLVWDLETSGLDKSKDKILEIGFAEVRNGEIVNSGQWFLKYEGLVIAPELTAIHGITNEMLEEKGVHASQAMLEFMDIFMRNKAHLTHNGIRFDIPFFAEQAMRTLGWTFEQFEEFTSRANRTAIDSAALYKAQHIIPTVRMWNETFYQWASRVMEWRIPGKYNLGHCCDQLGIDRSQVVQHRALGDIELTHHIYQKLIHS